MTALDLHVMFWNVAALMLGWWLTVASLNGMSLQIRAIGSVRRSKRLGAISGRDIPRTYFQELRARSRG